MLTHAQARYSDWVLTDKPNKRPKNHDIALLREAFGQALIAIRERRGLKQQDVAHSVGTTRNHLWRMEHGRGDPKLSMLWRLSLVLQVSPLDMMREVLDKFRELKKTPD